MSSKKLILSNKGIAAARPLYLYHALQEQTYIENQESQILKKFSTK